MKTVTVEIPMQEVADRYIGIGNHVGCFPMRHLSKDGQNYYMLEVSDGHIINNENVLRFVLKRNSITVAEVLLSCDQIFNQSQMIAEILTKIRDSK